MLHLKFNVTSSSCRGSVLPAIPLPTVMLQIFKSASPLLLFSSSIKTLQDVGYSLRMIDVCILMMCRNRRKRNDSDVGAGGGSDRKDLGGHKTHRAALDQLTDRIRNARIEEDALHAEILQLEDWLECHDVAFPRTYPDWWEGGEVEAARKEEAGRKEKAASATEPVAKRTDTSSAQSSGTGPSVQTPTTLVLRPRESAAPAQTQAGFHPPTGPAAMRNSGPGQVAWGGAGMRPAPKPTPAPVVKEQKPRLAKSCKTFWMLGTCQNEGGRASCLQNHVYLHDELAQSPAFLFAQEKGTLPNLTVTALLRKRVPKDADFMELVAKALDPEKAQRDKAMKEKMRTDAQAAPMGRQTVIGKPLPHSNSARRGPNVPLEIMAEEVRKLHAKVIRDGWTEDSEYGNALRAEAEQAWSDGSGPSAAIMWRMLALMGHPRGQRDSADRVFGDLRQEPEPNDMPVVEVVGKKGKKPIRPDDPPVKAGPSKESGEGGGGGDGGVAGGNTAAAS